MPSTLDILGSLHETLVQQEQVVIYSDDLDREIRSLAAIDEATPLDMSWIKGEDASSARMLEETKASMVVCAQAIAKPIAGKCIVSTVNPKYIFSHLAQELLDATQEDEALIHPSAFVHPEADLAPNVRVGALAHVGKARIGAGSEIMAGAMVLDNAVLGCDVRIHSGAVIGEHGSGYAKSSTGEYLKFPQIGSVVLEDRVEVGALSYINRGALGKTHLKEGVKIGNSVCIGHNVVIGKNSIVIANSVVAGSCHIGEHCYIAPSSTLRNALRIGDRVMIGMGSVVTKHIESDQVVMGNPASDIHEHKNWSSIRKNMLSSAPFFAKWLDRQRALETPATPDQRPVDA